MKRCYRVPLTRGAPPAELESKILLPGYDQARRAKCSRRVGSGYGLCLCASDSLASLVREM